MTPAAPTLPAPVALARLEQGTPGGPLPALVIMPGLFGQARNWGTLARHLAERRQVVSVDPRNQGRSPWSGDHSYPAMAADLAAVIEDVGAPCDLLGHSMGGKAAMVLALSRPELVRRLIVADIAPVAYAHSQLQLVQTMQQVGAVFPSRAAADEALAPLVPQPMVRSFLLQSLDVAKQRWRLNLAVLAEAMPQILGFPPLSGRFEGPALFLSGGASDYVQPEHHARILALFPHARFQVIEGAGHWLHAERPQETEAAIRAFLEG